MKPKLAFLLAAFSTGALPFTASAALDPFLHEARAVAVGESHSCVVLADSSVSCWGDNTWGQLGHPGLTKSSVPVPVVMLRSGDPLVDVVAIASGADFTCALQTGGSIYCWGRNDSGQLGEDVRDYVAHPYAIPVSMPSGDGMSQVTAREIAASATGSHACALLNDERSTVRCWGFNDKGQVGDGSTSDRWAPVTVVAPAFGGGFRPLENVRHIAAGGTHSCAVMDDVDTFAVCWGNNSSGQLSTGKTTDSPFATPVMVTPFGGRPYVLQDVERIVAGGMHTCAILDTTFMGDCWGENGNGQVGNPLAGARTMTPYGIPLAFEQLSAGDQHTCGVLTDGHVSCWGLNDSGQLGDGSTATQRSPIVLSMFGTMVSAGVSHSCAVMLDATVRCWGKNDVGQLGGGHESPTRYPVTVVRFNDRIFADDLEVRGGL